MRVCLPPGANLIRKHAKVCSLRRTQRGCRLGTWRRTTGRYVQSSHGNERRLRRKHAFAVAPHAGQDLSGVTQGPPVSNIWSNTRCLTPTLFCVQGLGGMPSMPNMQGKPWTFCFFSKSSWSRGCSSCHVSSIVASIKLPAIHALVQGPHLEQTWA